MNVVMNNHLGESNANSPETKKKQDVESKKKEKQRTRRGMKRIKDREKKKYVHPRPPCVNFSPHGLSVKTNWNSYVRVMAQSIADRV